ncbi:MAG: sugar phosphate nucleotidyltransferase, partial [Desulfocucumaceae bacterium]
MMPQLVLLAGGLATRLYPLTRTVPKSMVEVAGEPFIKHQLTLLKKKGITSVLICAGYLWEEIKEYVGDGKKFGVSVNYSFDGDRLLGTGGALVKALPLLDEVFWVMYGDSFLDTEFSAVYKFFKASDKPGLMTVFKNENRWDRSNILYSDGLIL